MAVPVHDLKCWPEFFHAIKQGRKSFDLRKNDRQFQVGDILLLREWIPQTEVYTGDKLQREVIYILRGPFGGIAADYCVMALAPTPSTESRDSVLEEEWHRALTHEITIAELDDLEKRTLADNHGRHLSRNYLLALIVLARRALRSAAGKE